MKTIKLFGLGDEVPSNANFIYFDNGRFYYEVSSLKTVKNKKTNKEVTDLIDRTITYLNKKTGSRFTSKAKTTAAHILARINEDATAEHFKDVIDNKCNDWLEDPKFSSYLRPETLFGTKFWGYLPSSNSVPDPFGDLESIMNEIE